MKRFIIMALSAVLFFVSCSFNAYADKPKKHESRKEWLKEMRSVKKDYLTKHLGLSSEQSAKFFPIYFAMEDEIHQLQQQTHKMAKDLSEKKDKATQLETDKTVEAVYELKAKEGAIELKYLPKFKEILSSKQLLKLKQSERKFTRDLMKHQKK